MTKREMARVEKRLGIQLPTAFREEMEEYGKYYRNRTHIVNGVAVKYYVDQLFIDPDQCIAVNLSERYLHATGGHFESWQHTYFIIGSGEGGNYYTIRLDNTPGVWMIGNHCGGVPARTHCSMSSYICWRCLQKPDMIIRPKRNVRELILEICSMDDIISDNTDSLLRLKFADLLQKSGLTSRAAFIRAQCVLDDTSPNIGTYADAIVQLQNCDYSSPEVELPAGFHFNSYNLDSLNWWYGANHAMERGFPSLATAYLEAAVEGDSPQLFALRLKSLIDTTTIRRLEIKEALPSYLEAFFASPSITSITGLKLPSNFHPNRLCPVVNALATSKLANTLTWIDYGLSLLGSVTAERLSTTEFSNLKKFTACMPAITSSDAFRLLMEAPWFYRLETLIMSVPPGAFGPVAMPNLHTLGVWRPSLYDATKYIIDADLPALRRIILYGASNLRGGASGLTTLRCGDIVELWLRATHPDELKLLLAAPWARRLEVLTVDSSQITIMNKIIDKSHCVKTLRVRRVGNFYGRNLRLFA